MKRFGLLLPLFVAAAFVSCKYHKPGLDFSRVKGTHFTEVRRIFNTGLSFDKAGYQLEPSWKLYFVTNDSVMVFSPKMKRYFGFHVYFDHDSVFNMVDAWFLLKRMNDDSLVLRSLRVENKKVLENDEGSNVFMTFYSDRYKNTKPAAVVGRMGVPGAKDTAYIKARSLLANTKIDSAFAGREPVALKSNSPLVTVEKVKNVSTPINKIDPSIDYLYPEYNVNIRHAYENFGYIFTVLVDDKGGMHFGESMIPYMPEFKANYEHVIKSIIAGYLTRYLQVTPGNTLGIAHTSSILLNVNGTTD